VRSYQRLRDGFFYRAESFYNVATQIEKLDEDPDGGMLISGAYGGGSLHGRSHGESVITLMTERFRGQGLYILDEPDGVLSPGNQLKMLRLIRKLVLSDSQFIITSHSPLLLAYPNAKIIQLDQRGYKTIAYEDTDQYRTVRDFLNDPAANIASLFHGS